MPDKKYFPIKTATACKLKWNWSTLYLNGGKTASCHRTGFSDLTPENFFSFHNTPLKISDRNAMLNGQWPDESCGYCRKIEEAGGLSDRMLHLNIPDLLPPELDTDPMAIEISPTILEVFFNNTCNLGCLYCSSTLSSTIATEDKKFGNFEKHGIKIQSIDTHYKDLLPYFWEWFPKGFQQLKRFHIMGGEPFYQQEFEKLLDMIKKYPNPECELHLVTNLMVSKKRLNTFLSIFKDLLISRKLKRVEISCSIDCLGPEQEYVRWGINLNQWEENFKILIENKWIYLGISQVISPLTIKTMPDLLSKLNIWREQRKINQWFSGVTPGPSYLQAEIFGKEEFAEDADKILALMPQNSEENKISFDYMQGIFKQILASERNDKEIINLLVYLTEKDRRRNTNWREVFPWLIKYEGLCGIQE